MRRALCLGLLVIGAATLVGTAGGAPPTTGTLSVKRGSGWLALDIRGAVLGWMARGELEVLIPHATCEELKVWGAEGELPPEFDMSTGVPMFACRFVGKGIRFRLVGNIGMEVRRVRNLHLSAVGRGTGEIDGAGGQTDGVWSLDDAEATSLPNTLRRFTLGRPFGTDD